MGALLYLMRHGAAEDVSVTGRDADRTLTPAGRDTVLKVALTLRAANVRPIRQVVASPLVRAQQTAEIMQSVLCPDVGIELHEDLTPDGSAYDLAVRLGALSSDTLLVGHQPNIEMVARALVVPARRSSIPARPSSPVPDPHVAASESLPPGIEARMPSGFRTATVVAFHVEGRPPPYRLALAVDPSALSTG